MATVGTETQICDVSSDHGMYGMLAGIDKYKTGLMPQSTMESNTACNPLTYLPKKCY